VVVKRFFGSYLDKSLGRIDVTKTRPGCWVLFKMAATMLEFWASLHGDQFHKENLHFRGLNLGDGRTGVFSWCMTSWFIFHETVNLGNYSSWSVTWRFLHDPWRLLELFTDIPDFTPQFYVIWRRRSSEWLESSIKSDLNMRFATRFFFPPKHSF